MSNVGNRYGRIVFFGTPDFAVPTLRALRTAGYEIPLVVTQPDKPAGRGQQLTPSPVKLTALEFGIPVVQPSSLKGLMFGEEPQGVDTILSTTLSAKTAELTSFVEALNSARPIDLFVVVAYGKIIPPPLLAFPRLGALNIHASLLPRWRGAAPIQRAIASGDRESGISLMALEEGLDTGPVYATRTISLSERETTGSLHDRLSTLGAEILLESLPEILSESIRPSPQPVDGVTYAERWQVEDAQIRWAQSADEIDRRVRASSPRPGAFSYLNGERVKIGQVTVERNISPSSTAPGVIVQVNRSQIIVATGSSDYIAIEELQFPGRSRLPVEEILKSRSIRRGEQFTEQSSDQ